MRSSGYVIIRNLSCVLGRKLFVRLILFELRTRDKALCFLLYGGVFLLFIYFDKCITTTTNAYTYIRLWAYTRSSIVGSGRANTIPHEPGFPTEKEEKKKKRSFGLINWKKRHWQIKPSCVLLLDWISYLSLFAFCWDICWPLNKFCIVVSGSYHRGLEALWCTEGI